MALSIDIAMNSRAAQRDAKDLSEALDSVSDAIDDVVRDSEKGGDRVERTFRDMTREAEKLADETKSTARVIDKEYGDAYRGARQSADDGMTGMSERSKEVSDELRGNLGETFSSFRGDLEDLPQIAQDTLGGLAGSGALGGIPGLAVTAAGAAGLGLIIGAFEKINEENEASQQRIAEWANAYIEAGGRVLSSSQIIASAQAIITDPEKWQEAKKNAELWGTSVETAILAQAGHAESMDQVSRALDRQRDAYEQLISKPTENYEAREKDLSNLEAAVGAYDRLSNEMEQGRAQADVLSQAMINVARSTAGSTEEVDEFGDTVITLPDGKQVYIDAETGQATQDVDAIERKVYGIQDHTVTVRAKVDDSAVRNWRPPMLPDPPPIVARLTAPRWQ